MHLVKRQALRQTTQLFTLTKSGSQVRTVVWLLMLPCSGLVIILVKLLKPVVEWFILSRPIWRPLTDWAKWCNVDFPFFFNYPSKEDILPTPPTPNLPKSKPTNLKLKSICTSPPLKPTKLKLLPPVNFPTTPPPYTTQFRTLKKSKKSKFNLPQTYLILNLETKWFKVLLNQLHTLQLLSFYEGLFIIQQRATTSVKNFKLLRNYLTAIVREEFHLNLIKDQLLLNALGRCDLNPWNLINSHSIQIPYHVPDPCVSLNRIKKRRLMLQSFANQGA